MHLTKDLSLTDLSLESGRVVMVLGFGLSIMTEEGMSSSSIDAEESPKKTLQQPRNSSGALGRKRASVPGS